MSGGSRARKGSNSGGARRRKKGLFVRLAALFSPAPRARAALRPTGFWAGVETGFGRLPRRWGLIASLALYAAAGFYAAVLSGGVDAAGAVLSGTARPVLALVSPAIERIDIAGAPRGKARQVRAALGVEPGEPVLSFDADAARSRLEALAWVREAQVRRLLPGTLEVRLVTRRPYAVWQDDGRLRVIDRAGIVLADARGSDLAALPLVVGAGANLHASAFLALMDARPALRARMRAAVRVADRRWNIRLLNDIDVRLPENDVAAALDELAALDEASGLLNRDIAAVDLRLADRVTIRLNPGDSATPPVAAPPLPPRKRKGAGA